MDNGDALLASGDGATERQPSSVRGMSRSQLKCVGKVSNRLRQTKGAEHATADPRTGACTTGAFTPGIALSAS